MKCAFHLSHTIHGLTLSHVAVSHTHLHMQTSFPITSRKSFTIRSAKMITLNFYICIPTSPGNKVHSHGIVFLHLIKNQVRLLVTIFREPMAHCNGTRHRSAVFNRQPVMVTSLVTVPKLE